MSGYSLVPMATMATGVQVSRRLTRPTGGHSGAAPRAWSANHPVDLPALWGERKCGRSGQCRQYVHLHWAPGNAGEGVFGQGGGAEGEKCGIPRPLPRCRGDSAVPRGVFS
jgi:hypothetical protein